MARGPAAPRAQYVVRSSGVGLGEDEHAALHGWLRWIAAEMTAYEKCNGLANLVEAADALRTVASPVGEGASTMQQLRRWAHIARRSRWPLLRDVVAESLRPALEPDSLDHLPLPQDPATLFELLCLVRIAHWLLPHPQDLRWLDRERADNELRLGDATCFYQQAVNIAHEGVASAFCPGLAEALPVFGFGLVGRIDLAFDFQPPLNGFDGIIVETKSGNQGPKETVGQLVLYRNLRPRRKASRYMLWGIVERAPNCPIGDRQREWLRRASEHAEGDLWAFSDAESIDVVLSAALKKPPTRAED